MDQTLLKSGSLTRLPARKHTLSRRPGTRSSTIFQTFPSDILFEIFQRGLPSIINARMDSAFILIVSQVCRSWRETTDAYPSLWASFRISWGAVKNADRYLRLWHLYLMRSAQTSLDLGINANGLASFQELFETTLAQQHRLRSFDIVCDVEQLSQNGIYIFHAAPDLKWVEISVNPLCDTPNRTGEAIWIDLAGCPALHSLDLYGGCYIYPELGSLASLRTVSLHTNNHFQRGQNVTPTFIFSLLQAAPNLESLDADVKGGVSVPQKPRSLVLARLRKLHLTFGFGGIQVPESLLRNLDLPMLESLQLRIHVKGLDDATWTHLNGLSSLQSLSLCYVSGKGPCGRSEIPSLLRFTPLLKHLSITGEQISNQIFRDLTLDSSHSSLCPLLESICISSDVLWGRPALDTVTLIKMIVSRGTLNYIRIRLPGLTGFHHAEAIQSRMKNGLVVKY